MPFISTCHEYHSNIGDSAQKMRITHKFGDKKLIANSQIEDWIMHYKLSELFNPPMYSKSAMWHEKEEFFASFKNVWCEVVRTVFFHASVNQANRKKTLLKSTCVVPSGTQTRPMSTIFWLKTAWNNHSSTLLRYCCTRAPTGILLYEVKLLSTLAQTLTPTPYRKN